MSETINYRIIMLREVRVGHAILNLSDSEKKMFIRALEQSEKFKRMHLELTQKAENLNKIYSTKIRGVEYNIMVDVSKWSIVYHIYAVFVDSIDNTIIRERADIKTLTLPWHDFHYDKEVNETLATIRKRVFNIPQLSFTQTLNNPNAYTYSDHK